MEGPMKPGWDWVRMRRLAFAGVLLALMVGGAGAQETAPVRSAYFAAVAEYFGVPDSEIDILGDWRLPPDEIPVVLFVAERAGVSPEALVALRRGGTSWVNLAGRYQVGAGALHVPLPAAAPSGRLERAFGEYRALPPRRWNEIRLTDPEIVALVNVRVLSESLGLSLQTILEQAGATGSFVELYGRLGGSE